MCPVKCIFAKKKFHLETPLLNSRNKVTKLQSGINDNKWTLPLFSFIITWCCVGAMNTQSCVFNWTIVETDCSDICIIYLVNHSQEITQWCPQYLIHWPNKKISGSFARLSYQNISLQQWNRHSICFCIPTQAKSSCQWSYIG